MNNKTYQSNKEALKSALIKAFVVGVSVAGFILLMNGDKSGYSVISKSIIFGVLFIIFFMMSFLNNSSMRTFQIRATETGISRTNYKGCFDYEIKWADIDLMIFGEVLDRYNRWDVWFEGLELRHKSEMGSPDKSVYKLEHITNADDFINELVEICHSKDIQVNDIRKK